ncbi:MAG: GNAT family N-acetyltransferase [Butyricicoccus sp.]|nr:GNAT family N-acetyltransferase [Butyricicoccus sp.]
MIRETTSADLQGLLELYTHLHNNPVPPESESLTALWDKICSDPDHHIIVAEEDGKLVSSCVCVIIPNLTHGQQPYAFVENVVTHADYRKRGLATACLHYARDIAMRENCYKLMLLTGSKLDSTLNFYERAGYDRKEKTAFIQRI